MSQDEVQPSLDRPLTPSEMLLQYADGELQADQRTDAMRKLTGDEATLARLEHQDQLRQRVALSLNRELPAQTPDSLRQQVLGMLAEHDEADKPIEQQAVEAGPEPVVARIGPRSWSAWLPAAVAAVLLIAAVVVLQPLTPGGSDMVASGNLLPVSMTQTMQKRHNVCKLNPDQIVKPNRPSAKTIDELPGTLREAIGVEMPVNLLDLQDLGYGFEVAGVCPVPGQDAMHLIYQPTREGLGSLSLWVQADNGQRPELKPGKVYIAADDAQDHPSMVWRNGSQLFYLVGDSMDEVMHAMDRLRQSI